MTLAEPEPNTETEFTMSDHQQTPPSPLDFFNDWLKMAFSAWAEVPGMAGTDAPKAEERASRPDEAPGAAFKAYKTWETAQKVIQSLIGSMSDPESLNNSMRGTEAVPELIGTIGQQIWDSYLAMQSKLLERAAKVGQQTQAYSFDDIDPSLFRTFREIYESEVQQFLNAPTLGLTRFYQERYNRFIDKYSVYQASLSELLYMFYLPLEKSAMVMQEKLEELAESGELHDDTKAYYNMWVQILEGHYMNLLKSSEYTQVLSNTIESLVAYKKAREDFLCDVLQSLPVPTYREMDALYKDIYDLKKQVKAMAKAMEESTD